MPKQIRSDEGRNSLLVFISKNRLAITLLLILASIGVWKCRRGVELQDELNHIQMGFKLVAEGDQFIKNEVFNAPKFHDVFNHYLVRPWVPYSVFAIRLSGFFFTAFVLGLLSWVTFRKRWGVLAALLLGPYLLMDMLGRPGWSYNDWARSMLVLHHAFVLVALFRKRAKSRPLWMFFSGLSLGFAMAVYQSLFSAAIAAAGASALVWCVSKFYRKEQKTKGFVGWYLLGAALPMAAAGAVILNHWEYWRFGNEVNYAAVAKRITPLKLLMLIGYCLTRIQLWMFLALWYFTRSTRFPVRFRQAGSALALFGLIAHYLYKVSQSFGHEWGWVLGSLVSLGFVGSLSLLLTGIEKKRLAFVWLAFLTPAMTFCIGMGSWAGNGSLYWAQASGALVFGLVLYRMAQAKIAWPRLAWIAALALVNFSVIRYTLTGTFKEQKPSKLTAKVSVAPFQGLYTTPSRAREVTQLAEWFSGKKFIFGYGVVPISFIFPGVRSSIYTNWSISWADSFKKKKALQFMLKYKRTPELIVIPRGTNLSMEGDPLLTFIRCSQETYLGATDNFQVFSVSVKQVEPCAHKALAINESEGKA